jgi:hypothetical protein
MFAPLLLVCRNCSSVGTAFRRHLEDLLREAGRWNGPVDLEREMRALVREHVRRSGSAIIRPHKEWLHETYLVVNVEQVSDPSGEALPGLSLLKARSNEIAAIVWGEDRSLCDVIYLIRGH